MHSEREAAGRESAAVPPCLPLQLVETSMVDFVALVSRHKTQLRAAFQHDVLQKICQQHKDLERIAAQEAPLKLQLQAKTRSEFSKS